MRHFKSIILCSITLLSVFLLASCSLAEQFFGQTQTSKTESSDITTTTTTAATTTAAPKKTKTTTATKNKKTTTAATTTTTTTTTAAPKTTRRATDAEIDLIRMQVENKYSLQLYNYETQLQQTLDSYEQQLKDLNSQYAANTVKLREQYANMGLLNSGAYNSALDGLNNKYTQNQNAIRDSMQAAKDNYDELVSAINDLIEAEIAAEIEKLQQSTLS